MTHFDNITYNDFNRRKSSYLMLHVSKMCHRFVLVTVLRGRSKKRIVLKFDNKKFSRYLPESADVFRSVVRKPNASGVSRNYGYKVDYSFQAMNGGYRTRMDAPEYSKTTNEMSNFE